MCTLPPEWCIKSYTLTTHEMEERHTSENIADDLVFTLHEWEIAQKVFVIVADNAKNMVNAISLISETVEVNSITCAAHTLQLAVNTVLKEENVQNLIRHCSRVVGHFKHSNIAEKALEQKQEQLGMQKSTLLQCCSTRWNSTSFMLERLHINRCPISNTIADRSVTNSNTAKKLEINESQWERIESLVNVLKPLQIVTTLFCTEGHSPITMVRPLIRKLIEKHLSQQNNSDEIINTLKETIISELVQRFNLDYDENDFVTPNHISCFLDPRYKDLDHEPIHARAIIRSKVKSLLEGVFLCAPNREEKSVHKSALQFIYDEANETSDLSTEFDAYVAEPQLKFDLDAFEWWKTRKTKYPRMAELAMKYLTIPATSVASERCFSTAGNIVTPKRNRLLPENGTHIMQEAGVYVLQWHNQEDQGEFLPSISGHKAQLMYFYETLPSVHYRGSMMSLQSAVSGKSEASSSLSR